MKLRTVFLLLLAALASPASAQAPCVDRLCYADNLDPFFDRLGEARRDSGQPVHILQIGDSHTAGDMITNGWREALRQRYGHGGRGVLAAGRPYAGYLTWGVTASQTAGWEVNGIFGRAYANYGRPIGLSGFSQTARATGESIGISADTPDQSFDRIIVCGIAEPGAGAVTIRLGFETETLDFNAAQRHSECKAIDSAYPQIGASLTTLDDRIVTITSFATMRQRGGVILSNVGVSGSQLVHFGRNSDETVRAELEQYRPDLIVIAFGTNEGFSQQLSPSDFEADLRNQVTRIRRLAGRSAPILLLGAPDAQTQNRGLADNFGSPVACDSGWYTPTLLGELRSRQRRVAQSMGLGFWDWNAAMGGRCSAHRWRTDDLMRGDHVHFNQRGGARIGRMIFDDLERASAAHNAD